MCLRLHVTWCIDYIERACYITGLVLIQNKVIMLIIFISCFQIAILKVQLVTGLNIMRVFARLTLLVTIVTNAQLDFLDIRHAKQVGLKKKSS